MRYCIEPTDGGRHWRHADGVSPVAVLDRPNTQLQTLPTSENEDTYVSVSHSEHGTDSIK